MSHRYYLESELIVGQTYQLSGTEAHHLLNVMRCKSGDEIELFDGRGAAGTAVITETSRRDARLQLQRLTGDVAPNLPRILVAAATPKGDRLRFMLEKLTELGADAWLPLSTQHSVNSLNPGILKKAGQWVIDACKQSGRNSLLTIFDETPLNSVWENYASVPIRKIAATPENWQQTSSSASPATKQCDAGGDSPWDQMILVGPEGGFSDQELTSAHLAGFQPVQIGGHILRIETAAIAALSISLPVKSV